MKVAKSTTTFWSLQSQVRPRVGEGITLEKLGVAPTRKVMGKKAWQ